MVAPLASLSVMGSVQSDGESAPLEEVVPFGQLLQLALPVLSWYWPGEQLMQKL